MPPDMVIQVAAAAIFNGAGQLLLSRRSRSSHQGGLWEFPGGKLEAGESVTEALVRELAEELDIRPLEYRPLIRVRHDYGDRRVLLDVWRVNSFNGVPRGREGQPLQWVSPAALPDYEFPAANLPILKAVRLPDCYAISPAMDDSGSTGLLEQLEQILDRGVRLVQLRQKQMQPRPFQALARAMSTRCAAYGASLLINAGADSVDACNAHGVHLSSRRLLGLEQRPLGAAYLVGASCHNPAELQHACELGLDFAVCSPVLPTPSHPGEPGLGWRGFEQLTELATLPVFALGGMDRDSMDRAWQHGGQGIAGIRGLWGR